MCFANTHTVRRATSHSRMFVPYRTSSRVEVAVAGKCSYLQAEARGQPLGLLVCVTLRQNGGHEHLRHSTTQQQMRQTRSRHSPTMHSPSTAQNTATKCHSKAQIAGEKNSMISKKCRLQHNRSHVQLNSTCDLVKHLQNTNSCTDMVDR
jgi:hypothetical protein